MRWMRRKHIVMLVGLGILALGMTACMKKVYINLTYQLPPASEHITGRRVYIETQDMRADTDIFNAAAKEKFQYFSGLFSLAVEAPDQQRFLLGAYPLPALFETALKKRLEQMGITVVDQKDEDVPRFQVKINRFRINLIDQKWQTDIDFEVSLSQNEKRVAREAVSGSGERMKVIGSRDAEKVISEIFSEMINQLNIERLFQQANL
ncbi:hypothetical protein DESC_830117 [Desulfosarcina cetonica]|nr:hypothetical protein DESC_830117 [Desulfosarcina cetonica]